MRYVESQVSVTHPGPPPKSFESLCDDDESRLLRRRLSHRLGRSPVVPPRRLPAARCASSEAGADFARGPESVLPPVPRGARGCRGPVTDSQFQGSASGLGALVRGLPSGSGGPGGCSARSVSPKWACNCSGLRRKAVRRSVPGGPGVSPASMAISPGGITGSGGKTVAGSPRAISASAAPVLPSVIHNGCASPARITLNSSTCNRSKPDACWCRQLRLPRRQAWKGTPPDGPGGIAAIRLITSGSSVAKTSASNSAPAVLPRESVFNLTAARPKSFWPAPRKVTSNRVPRVRSALREPAAGGVSVVRIQVPEASA